MQGDDLQVSLFFLAIAAGIALTIVQLMGWKHPVVMAGLWALLALCVGIGTGWPWIKDMTLGGVVEIASEIGTNPASFLLAGLGIGYGLRRSRRAATPEPGLMPSAPPVAKEKPRPAYTQFQREERSKAWSEIYAILNQLVSPAIDKAVHLSNAWKEEVQKDPAAYRGRLKQCQVAISAAMNQITEKYNSYGYPDIRDYFENGWGPPQGAYGQGTNVLKDTLGLFRPSPGEGVSALEVHEYWKLVAIRLLEQTALAAREGAHKMGAWRTSALAYAAAQKSAAE